MERETYIGRVPEQFNRYSPVSTIDDMVDIDAPGISNTLGTATEYEQRETHIRRDVGDNNKNENLIDIHRGFTDATEALIYFLSDVVKPVVLVNGEIKPIPIMYVNAEKWVSIQQYGYIKDENGKSMAPIISVRRTSMDNSEITRLRGTRAYGNEISYAKRFSTLNRYDNFNTLNNQVPLKEIHSISLPEWWKVEYEVILWTELISQMDKLIEDITYYRGVPIGSRHGYKYRSDITAVSAPETTNATGEDKLVKSNLTFELNVPIVSVDSGDDVNMRKSISIGKVYFGAERII